jgi:two-component system chemotaxis response regulator CheB
MKKIRVMIVEDSAVVRALLEHSIGRDPRLEICATAASAEDALQLIPQLSPDVIAMDIRLPGMSNRPIPIVVVAASVESKVGNSTLMEALRAGALTVLEKPLGITNADYEELEQRLCTQLVIMSQVKLVRQHVNGEPRAARSPVPYSCSGSPGAFKMLGIACSTGGPRALVQLLGALGPEFPLPILLVQHMTASFLEGFASWLDAVCPFAVSVVNDGCIPMARALHMAPAERHLRLDGGRLRLDAGDPISFMRPSGTVLFQSMARDLGADALGVVLTGMGEDGALGLLDMRQSGGYTIAEDESTAVVYGMPAAAVRMGAVCESLPLPAIAGRVLELAAGKHRQAVPPDREVKS